MSRTRSLIASLILAAAVAGTVSAQAKPAAQAKDTTKKAAAATTKAPAKAATAKDTTKKAAPAHKAAHKATPAKADTGKKKPGN